MAVSDVYATLSSEDIGHHGLGGNSQPRGADRRGHSHNAAGRPTWSATCRPLMGDGEDWEGGYDPRCGCCPLLDSAASRLPEYGPDDQTLRASDLSTTYLVQLDVQTAIAVQINAVDGWAAQS